MTSDNKKMRCGLIGEHLGHSFSPLIHACLADYSYELREIAPEELERFVTSRELDAYNVAIPYKKAIMPYLDEISSEALAIGAVNTVVRRGEKLYGYNTDYFGFCYMLERSKINVKGKKALILGAGGAAATAYAVLRDKGAQDVITLSSKQNTPENVKLHSDAEIIVNATPVGTYPNNLVSPVDLTDFTNLQELAARWFVGEEQTAFFSSPTKETFLRIWTRKEAYAKYIGEGLRALSKIDTVALENEGRIRFFDYREGTILISVCVPSGTDAPQFCKL